MNKAKVNLKIAILGKPNVGKSTLFNIIMEKKIAPITQKSQTTIDSLLFKKNIDNKNILLIDLPGMFRPSKYKDVIMLKKSSANLENKDLFFLVVSATYLASSVKDIINILKKYAIPTTLIINKIDLIDVKNVLPLIKEYNQMFSFKDIIPISLIKKNSSEIMKKYIKSLNLSTKEEDVELSDKKDIFTGMLREVILLNLHEEVPYNCSIVTKNIYYKKNKVIVRQDIYVTKEKYKPMIIGHNGATIKNIGTRTRLSMEKFLGKKVFLNINVKSEKIPSDDKYKIVS